MDKNNINIILKELREELKKQEDSTKIHANLLSKG